MKRETMEIPADLKDTEKKLLELLSTGASSKSIAEQMGLKDGTTRVYLHALYRRIGVNNKTSAVTWYLAQRQEALPPPQVTLPLVESFGDRAVQKDLLSALGMMEIFLGPYGRMWDMWVQLEGDTSSHQNVAAVRARSRELWSAMLSGKFIEVAEYFDREGVAKLFIESPSDAVVLAASLLLGGYTARAAKAMSSIKVRKGGSIGITLDEKAALAAIAEVVNERQVDSALAALHRLIEKSVQRPVFRHLLIVALFHLYRMRGEPGLARDVGNAIWVEAESARKHLESMGDKTLPTEAQLPTAPKIPKTEVTRYLASLTS